MKKFNIAGVCVPEKHYMVDLTSRLDIIKQLIEDETYFCINRGRQYGKTTTINAICDYLREDYSIFSITLENEDDTSFKNLEKVLSLIIKKMQENIIFDEVYNVSKQNQELIEQLAGKNEISSTEFTMFMANLVRNNDKEIVLIIDEVDQAGKTDGFLRFLGVLRAAYLNRVKRPTFKAVILSSVYDVKNLRRKIPDSQGSTNSPWNIAVSFDVSMEFSAEEISAMLKVYMAEHNIEFDVEYMAGQIANYTGGYPSLVSRLCKKIDEEKLGWNKEGLLTAVRNLLKESNTLFDDLCKKLRDNPEMKNIFKQILYQGQSYAFDINNSVLNLAYAFRFIKNNDGKVQIANPIFETMLYNLFLSEEETSGKVKSVDKNQFILDGHLDIELVLEKFSQHYNEIYNTKEIKLLEADCRRIFMLYVKPIINGTGNYYIEAENRDGTRTDMVIDYRGEQFVIEMKVWHGDAYNQRGEKQILDYLEKLNTDKGYLISFCFNKNKVVSRSEKQVEGKTVIEYVV